MHKHHHPQEARQHTAAPPPRSTIQWWSSKTTHIHVTPFHSKPGRDKSILSLFSVPRVSPSASWVGYSWPHGRKPGASEKKRATLETNKKESYIR